MTTARSGNIPADCESMGLTPGRVYDVGRLRLVGWWNEAGDIDAPDGYDCWAYFAADGRYLGPDADGITPAFAGDEGDVAEGK